MCVQGRETFTYTMFCKYVVNIEMLSEVMHLASEQGRGVVIDILPGGVAGGAPSPCPPSSTACAAWWATTFP